MRRAVPYAALAPWYNRALGVESFRETCRAFERLAARHAIHFGSAADLGCGTGLFACYLAARFGVPVFAVDRSTEMLDVARRGCRHRAVRFLHQDIRWLRLPAAVDLATANFDTLNHLTEDRDLERAIERVAANLRPGGHFVFDLLTPAQVLPPGRLVGRLLPTRDGDLGQLMRWDPSDRRISVTIVRRDPRGVTVEEHRERAYAPERVTRRLKVLGFAVRDVCDARTLAPAGDRSARVIVVARARNWKRVP